MLELDVLVIEQIELASDREPWERQTGEQSVDWQLFRAYRDLPPVNRSLVKAYKVAYGPSSSPTSVYAICTPASRRNRWAERVELYDRYIDQQVRKALLAQQISTRLALAQLGMALREKAAEALATLEATKSVVLIDSETGARTSYPVTTLSPASIVAFAKAGAALENEALGLSTSGGVGVQVNVAVVAGQAALTDDDTLIAEATRVLKARREQLRTIDDQVNTTRQASTNRPS